MTPDGQLDRNELASYVCAKQKAKAAPSRSSAAIVLCPGADEREE